MGKDSDSQAIARHFFGHLQTSQPKDAETIQRDLEFLSHEANRLRTEIEALCRELGISAKLEWDGALWAPSSYEALTFALASKIPSQKKNHLKTIIAELQKKEIQIRIYEKSLAKPAT